MFFSCLKSHGADPRDPPIQPRNNWLEGDFFSHWDSLSLKKREGNVAWFIPNRAKCIDHGTAHE